MMLNGKLLEAHISVIYGLHTFIVHVNIMSTFVIEKAPQLHDIHIICFYTRCLFLFFINFVN